MQKLSLVDETFDLNFISEYHLSIQFSLDGFSFCILDGIQKKYVFLSHQPGISSISPLAIKQVQDIVEKDDQLSNKFKTTRISYSSPTATLAPLSYLKKNRLDEITKLNFGEQKGLSTLNHLLSPFQDEIIFTLPENLKAYIENQFPDSKITHECLPFIWNACNSVHADNFLSVLIRKDYFWMMYVEKNRLSFFNSISYQNDDDILYYILNMASKLTIDVEKTPIFMEGMTSKKSAIYHRIRQYIKHVQLSGPSTDCHYSYLFNQIPDSRFVSLLNLHSCAL